MVGADLWEGDATKHFSVKKEFSVKRGGRHTVNEGFRTDFYKEGNSVNKSRPLGEVPDSESWKVALLIRKQWEYCFESTVLDERTH